MSTNFTKNKKFSIMDYGNEFNFTHEYFTYNSYHVDSLLSNFVENMMDLSLNEISVHFLGHTDI